MFTSRVVVSLALVAKAAANHTFFSIGDWGGAALGSHYEVSEYAVAAAMVQASSSTPPEFVVNLGDSFYWCGVQSVTDYQIGVDFEKPFADSSLQVPWYGVLGNHEYGYNVSAVMEYADISKRWIMDDRYYTRRVEIGTTGNFISFIFIDTTPCIADYRGDDEYWWDPCGSSYPTCSLTSTDDDFEGECEFHANVLSQDCETQYNWLKSALDAVPSEDWLVVVGHHPIDEVDVNDFTSLLQAHGFDLYLNGHAHTLTQYTVDYEGAYVTTGAGALVAITSASGEVEEVDEHVPKGPRAEAKVNGQDWPKSGQGHSYQTVWNQKVAGFTRHSFSADLSSLATDFLDYNGNIVHTFDVQKGESRAKAQSKAQATKAASSTGAPRDSA